MLSPTDIDKDNVIQVVVGCKSDLSSDRKVSPEMGQAQYYIRTVSSYTVVDLAKICTTPLFKRFQ